MQTLTEKIATVLRAHRALARQFFHPRLRRPVPQHTKRTPLFFHSQVAWDTVWQRPQEQAIGLSRFRPVIFFSPVQLHELTQRLWDRWQFLRVLEGGRLVVISPLIFSGEYRSPAVRRINRLLMKILVRHLRDYDKLIYMTNSPFAPDLGEFLQPSAVLFDLIDDFCAFNWAPPGSREQEAKLISMTDLAFAGTGFLQKRYQDRLQGLEFLPSGVRYSFLTTPVAEPEDIASLPRPRILYIGTLNDRLNGELFGALAREFPGGSVIAVGPRHETFRAPDLPSNVHFLGLKPHTELPGYYQHCDLGIMPFADNDAARAINPVKTLEYLSCGLPVLSTPIPDVLEYYPGVVRCELPEAWPAAARELLEGNDCAASATRQLFAQDRDWSQLVLAMERQIRRLEGDLE